jgi:hypothetical protein
MKKAYFISKKIYNSYKITFLTYEVANQTRRPRCKQNKQRSCGPNELHQLDKTSKLISHFTCYLFAYLFILLKRDAGSPQAWWSLGTCLLCLMGNPALVKASGVYSYHSTLKSQSGSGQKLVYPVTSLVSYKGISWPNNRLSASQGFSSME